MPWYRQLHWQIALGLILGLLYGVLAVVCGWIQFTSLWITPLGTIFIKLLKLIAVPLIISSLVTGISSLSDLRKLSRIGSKTIILYLVTTTIATTLGLIIVNVAKPGDQIPHNMRNQLQATYQQDANSQMEAAQKTKQRTLLQPLVDMVPENFFQAASLNRNMLQVVFLALLLGIALIQIPHDKARPLLLFFESLNLAIISLVGLIMRIAPIGVFALISDTITSIAHDNIKQILALLGALGFYCLTVVIGLTLHTLLTYPLLIKIFTTTSIRNFFSSIAPAQLVAFSTSSSSATLPITMECCEENLNVSEEVSSFVLPLGATINMDGTALYQSVAAVFIAQSLGMGLDLTAQLTIVMTALLASIGSAGVPGAGIIMLVIILEAVGVPSTSIALILGVDRILDMVRTTTNITGDAAVAVIVSTSEKQSDTITSQ